MAVRTLVVDDEATILESLSRIVTHAGYECLLASSAQEALDLLELHPVDVVISDMRMPCMDGLELLGQIRTRYKEVDVILMTGFDSRDIFSRVIEAGAADFIAKPFHQDELLAKLKRIVRERELKAELLYLSIHDGLTGLFNRRYLYQKLQEEVERAKRQRRNLALIILDVDRFKDYNDSHGHLDGDQVLVTLGSIINSSIRQNVDTAYRYGGDEFAVMLIETNLEQACKVAERIRTSFESRQIDNCTLSLGLAALSVEKDSMEDLIRKADEAMYRAKRGGGNRVEVFQCAKDPSFS